jgi:hypothetical protein
MTGLVWGFTWAFCYNTSYVLLVFISSAHDFRTGLTVGCEIARSGCIGTRFLSISYLAVCWSILTRTSIVLMLYDASIAQNMFESFFRVPIEKGNALNENLRRPC